MAASRRLVAIHQPNFFPWLGYFNKIARADVFIVLDDAQFQKTGGTWCNRVRVLIAGSPAWLTVPVDRSYHGVVAIKDVRVRSDIRWREKLIATLRASYGRTPFFTSLFPALALLIENPTDSLAAFNTHAITSLCDLLHLDASRCVLASSLGVNATATDRLIQLVRCVGGDAYLVGGGAEGYQHDELFAQAGIALVPQRFNHPSYQQRNAPQFVAGLSVMDALLNCGAAGTRALLVGT